MKRKKEKTLETFGKMVEQAIKNPELVPDRVIVISLTEKEKNKILTPERLRLVKTIKEKNPKSVKELAKHVNRRVDAVSRDLKLLQNYGILEMLQRGKQKKPEIEKDILMIPLTA